MSRRAKIVPLLEDFFRRVKTVLQESERDLTNGRDWGTRESFSRLVQAAKETMQHATNGEEATSQSSEDQTQSSNNDHHHQEDMTSEESKRPELLENILHGFKDEWRRYTSEKHSSSHVRSENLISPDLLLNILREVKNIWRQFQSSGGGRHVGSIPPLLEAILREIMKGSLGSSQKNSSKYLQPMPGYLSRGAKPIRRNMVTSTFKHLGLYRGK